MFKAARAGVRAKQGSYAYAWAGRAGVWVKRTVSEGGGAGGGIEGQGARGGWMSVGARTHFPFALTEMS